MWQKEDKGINTLSFHMSASNDLIKLSIIVLILDIKKNWDLMVKDLAQGHSVVKPPIPAERLQSPEPLCSTTQEFLIRMQI